MTVVLNFSTSSAFAWNCSSLSGKVSGDGPQYFTLWKVATKQTEKTSSLLDELLLLLQELQVPE